MDPKSGRPDDESAIFADTLFFSRIGGEYNGGDPEAALAIIASRDLADARATSTLLAGLSKLRFFPVAFRRSIPTDNKSIAG